MPLKPRNATFFSFKLMKQRKVFLDTNNVNKYFSILSGLLKKKREMKFRASLKSFATNKSFTKAAPHSVWSE